MTIAGGLDRARSPWLNRLVELLNEHYDERHRVLITGMRPSGDDIVIRFLAARACQYVRVHIQHDGAGGGGESYDDGTYVSDTRIDCRESRQQDTTITRDTAHDYYVWLIPEFLQGDRTSYTRFDGEDGDDQMAFVALGANSQKVEEMKTELKNLNERMDRLLTQMAVITDLVLSPGEK